VGVLFESHAAFTAAGMEREAAFDHPVFTMYGSGTKNLDRSHVEGHGRGMEKGNRPLRS
jgi:hypothetical protein